jgi:ribosomal protein L17
MKQKMTGGLLTAALALSVLCTTAQQAPDRNDQQGDDRPRKQLTYSGSYSVNTKGRSWVTYNDQQARIDRMQAELDAMQRKLDNEMIRSLISDLVAEKILADEDQCKWLALTADKLIVNGKTQSKALHRKFKKKYIRKAGFGIFYGNPPKQGGEPESDSEE